MFLWTRFYFLKIIKTPIILVWFFYFHESSESISSDSKGNALELRGSWKLSIKESRARIGPANEKGSKLVD